MPNDGIESRFLTQISPRGSSFGDGDGHRRVVGPFTGLPCAAASHGDFQLGSAWWAELIGILIKHGVRAL
jgi:hypothetical protein